MILLFSLSTLAQTSQKMSYQAIIRDNQDNLIIEKEIGMQITILQGSANGDVVYSELQTPITNKNGLISIEIGGRAGFSTINWANGPYFIKIEADPTGGTNYTISGTSQLLSVPYAFFAQTAENISSNAAPTITNQEPTNIKDYSANLNCIINGKGFSTNVVFEWGLTTDYGNTSTSNQNPVTGNTAQSVSVNVAGLQANTTYHYRIKATNAVNVSYSDDKSFTTTLSAPQLTTTSVSNVLAFSATSGGNITYNGGSSVTSRGICYSTNSSPTISDNVITTGNGTGSFTVSLSNLQSATKYYIRAYATNAVGTTYGNELNFTTQNGVASLTTTGVSDLAGSTGSSGGNISSNGGDPITTRGICWSTSNNPTIALNTKTSNNSGSGSFTSTLTNLVVGTKYYVRAYATNSLGTYYGNEISFIVGAIGTIYMNGIVFYLDETGQHGLVCATSDQRGVGNGIGWTNGTFSVTGATGTTRGTGKSNTDAIISNLGSGTYAAQICNDLEPKGTWFLPSKDELYLMYSVVKLNGYSTFGGYYWASTEGSSSTAWEMTFSDGTGLYTVKNDNTRLVRAIREF